ncbi:hypothetical protein SLINC_4119 [Streptomyces lincolnensis]|uniref:Uncharacterized protein n=1 Tax=Streptomyces lincolnensis TaxID=1915 RepID=A0A1B1MCW9_STRLN|nr:hypothetical protein [Streptomyces lincolnensis]ANS66343.1 hypothetical protein SLINC_4119 [Streptomyces lincolnensis]AXG55213.1 hypothetical protein SLCG_4058 [Streptomyces lincolnensis]QMV08265.1 hypothetical protein GJU35_23215 [Streptomyces lincolnensis]
MSAVTTPRQDDSPATALGPVALFLGLVAATGAWPALMFATLPWSLIAGGLAVTFGASGIHYARQGIGRMWTAVAGTTLGAVGLVGVYTLIGFA